MELLSISTHELIGYIGGFLLAICGLPEMIRSIRNNYCDIGHLMLSSWLIGEILVFLYVLPNKDIPLLLNYGANIVFITVMYYYKIFGEKNGKKS